MNRLIILLIFLVVCIIVLVVVYFTKEHLGSFSLNAAVRPPYNCCKSCGDCDKEKIVGVS